jgi:hypothetical protein
MICRPAIRGFLRLFFDGKYLVGRHFDNGLAGYLWGIQSVWQKNILRLSKPTPFPSALTCRVSNGNNISFHPDDLNNFQSPGLYLQNFAGKIVIGRGCYLGPNVGIITANHKMTNLAEHASAKDVELGEGCWIGMNSVILPGVVLGPRTIVGAGSVVTKSFPQGDCVVVGSPARVMSHLVGSSTPEAGMSC